MILVSVKFVFKNRIKLWNKVFEFASYIEDFYYDRKISFCYECE